MKLFEVKFIVRQHFANLQLSPMMLNLSLTQGRREIETHGNWWWMKKEKDFSLVIDQSSYSITTSTSNGLNLPKFKDARGMIWKEDASATRFDPVAVGKQEKQDLDILYGTDDKGSPEAAAIDNVTLYIYPPKPQTAYVMRLYHYEWTDNPTNLNNDDLLNFFPMALAYSSMAWGYEMVLKDLEGAAYWKQLLGGTPFGRGGLIAQMKKENFKRGQQDQIDFTPRGGPGRAQRRRLDNIQIYR